MATTAAIEAMNAAFAEWAGMVDAEFGEGTWQHFGGSFTRLFLQRPETLDARVLDAWERQRDRDLDILASGLVRRWRLHSVEKARLRKLASENRRPTDAEKLDVARIGLLLVAEELDKPCKFRLGTHPWVPEQREREWAIDQHNVAWLPRAVRGHRSTTVSYGRGQWIKGGDGRQISVTPSTLPPTLRLSWFVSAAKRAASDWLNDSWTCSDATASFDETLTYDALHNQIAAADVEDALFPGVDLDALAAAADLTRAESELLDSFLTCDGGWQAAANHLALSTGALRQRRSRLITKLRAAA